MVKGKLIWLRGGDDSQKKGLTATSNNKYGFLGHSLPSEPICESSSGAAALLICTVRNLPPKKTPIGFFIKVEASHFSPDIWISKVTFWHASYVKAAVKHQRLIISSPHSSIILCRVSTKRQEEGRVKKRKGSSTLTVRNILLSNTIKSPTLFVSYDSRPSSPPYFVQTCTETCTKLLLCHHFCSVEPLWFHWDFQWDVPLLSLQGPVWICFVIKKLSQGPFCNFRFGQGFPKLPRRFELMDFIHFRMRLVAKLKPLMASTPIMTILQFSILLWWFFPHRMERLKVWWCPYGTARIHLSKERWVQNSSFAMLYPQQISNYPVTFPTGPLQFP